jgi:hypothetical protein
MGLCNFKDGCCKLRPNPYTSPLALLVVIDPTIYTYNRTTGRYRKHSPTLMHTVNSTTYTHTGGYRSDHIHLNKHHWSLSINMYMALVVIDPIIYTHNKHPTGRYRKQKQSHVVIEKHQHIHPIPPKYT